MAAKTKTYQDDTNKESGGTYAKDSEQTYVRDFREDLDAHDKAIQAVPYDALEAMESAKTFDLQSRQTKNALTDSMTDTIYRERAARVVGNLPNGEVKALGKKDAGKGLFMDLIRTHWIYPNANAQRSFKQKLYMWKKKISVYNTVCAYVDKTTSPSGYEGPDFWLWNPRNVVPQRGKASINDMDYLHLISFWSPKQFEAEIDDPDSTYDKKVLRELLPSIKEGKVGRDTERQTKQASDSGKQTKLVTRYEAGPDGKWCTFLPDYGHKVIREIKNPHENARIPVVAITGEPEFDSWYGTSDYQRSMPMQAADDGTLNGYFQGMNKALNPRTFVDTSTMVDHTWSDKPGALIEFTGPFTVKPEEISTASLSNFQSVQGVIKGALQSIAGTTQDTSLTGEMTSNPQFSKTPEGLRLRSEQEATRDKQDRSTFEEGCKELIDLMLSVVLTMKNKIPVDLLEEEMQEILRDHPDLGEILTDGEGNPLQSDGQPVTKLHTMLGKAHDRGVATMRPSESKQQLRLRIDPQKLKGLEYRFELDPDSTAAQSKEAKLGAFKDMFAFLGTVQNVVQEHPEILSIITKTFGELADIPQMAEVSQALQQLPPQQDKSGTPPKELLNYKDAPDDIKRQIEQAAGFTPSQQPGTSPASVTQTPEQTLKDAHQQVTTAQEEPLDPIHDTRQRILAMRSQNAPGPAVPNR